MKLKMRLAAAAAALAVAGGGFAFAAANAGVSPVVKYTAKSTGAVAGYYAQTQGQAAVGFTHITAYLGNDGQANQEKFDPSAPPLVQNGGGVGLCDQTLGNAAQAGDVYTGSGLLSVVLGTGNFGSAVLNNGDICENGIVSPAGGITVLSGVPVNDTVKVDLLYDGHHAHNGCFAGQILMLAQDISASGPVIRSACEYMPRGTEFTEADAGVVADTQAVSSLPFAHVPAPDVKGDEHLLMTFAHVFLNGNYLTQRGEVQGTFQSSAAWTVIPVASTSNGQPVPAGALELAPGLFSQDHFRVFVGDAVA